jgi:hypothetical protein
MTAGKKLDPKVAEKVMLKAGLKPLLPYVNSGTKWKCKCLNCGGIVFPRYSSIKNGFGGCIKCGLVKMKLKQRTPEKEAIQRMIKAGFEPLEPYKNAHSKWKCKCLKCGKNISITYGNIRSGFSGRKQCCSPVAVHSKEEAIKKFATQGFILLQPYTISSAYLKVECKKCGKISKRSYQSLETRGKKPKCVWCANLRKDSKEVVAFMTKNGLKPKTPYKGANEPWKCICLKCKKEVSSSYASVRDGSGCGYCKKNIVDPKDARKNMISWGYKPLEPYKNNHKNWKSMHIPCKNIVNPTYAQLQQGNGGCRHCAEWGFQYDKESYLYLITHNKLGAHKIGIGNVAKKLKADRLHRLKIEGWKIHKVWNFDEGKKALIFEKRIFQVLRKELQLPIFLSKDQIRNEGYSETINADSITLLELEKIIKKVIKG